MNARLCLTLAAFAPIAANALAIETTTHTYKTVKGHALKADVYLPDTQGPRPAVMFMHGGACIWGSRVNRPPSALRTALLKAGYVIVSIDYRLAPETKLPEIARDVEDAYGWIRKAGPRAFAINAERVALMGGSAGGYLALLAGARISPPPAALVAISGYGDLTWYGSGAIPKEARKRAYKSVGQGVISIGARSRSEFYKYCRKHQAWIQEVAGIDPRTASRPFDRLRPILGVTPKYPPTLLIHSKRDFDVPYRVAVKMDDMLEKKGVKHQLISVDDNTHSSGLIAKHPEVSDKIVVFLDRHLPDTGRKRAQKDGRAQPPP